MMEFSWELQHVLSGLKRNLLQQQVTKFLRPHIAIWGTENSNFPSLADEIMALLPTQEKKRQFLSVCLAAYLLDPSKAPAAAPAWMQKQSPISEIIGIQAPIEELLTWQWDRAAFPVLDNRGKNDTIYYALVAASLDERHPLMPSWISDVIAADAQDAVTVAAELARKASPESGFFFWPFINPQKPTHDRSLGLPVYLSFFSVAGRTNIPPIIATGEITLQGRLVPVQGVQHKCDKACEKQYKRFIYPEDGSRLEIRRDFTPVGVNNLEEAAIEWGLKQRNNSEQHTGRQSQHTQAGAETNGTAQTQAYFDDIQLHILNALRKARNTIHIAVAWFTDQEIFDLLCKKQQAGVRVELIIVNDAINRKSPIQYAKLSELGGLFLMIGDKKKSSAIMHNKFCVIDGVTVITGSYNWSKQAQENWENITIISGDTAFARQFLQEFSAIQDHATGEAAKQGLDHGKIMQRLEALRHVIDLDDDDDIELQLTKLKRLIPEGEVQEEVQTIIGLVASGNNREAVTKISEYVSNRKQVAVYVDPEIPWLKLELKTLEIQVGALENEKAELEKLLHAYHFRYNTELGNIVRKILKLRAERLLKESAINPDKEREAEEAREDYESFDKGVEESQHQTFYSLDEKQKDELKALFRSASKLCHTDMVSESDEAEAKELFIKLNDAYKKNDFETVRDIYENLKNGHFSTAFDKITDAKKLLQQVTKLRNKVKQLQVLIHELMTSDVYSQISVISNWDEHFLVLKDKLLHELEALETDDF